VPVDQFIVYNAHNRHRALSASRHDAWPVRGSSDFPRLSVSPTPRSDYQPQVYKNAYFRAEIGILQLFGRAIRSGASEGGVLIVNFWWIITLAAGGSLLVSSCGGHDQKHRRTTGTALHLVDRRIRW